MLLLLLLPFAEKFSPLLPLTIDAADIIISLLLILLAITYYMIILFLLCFFLSAMNCFRYRISLQRITDISQPLSLSSRFHCLFLSTDIIDFHIANTLLPLIIVSRYAIFITIDALPAFIRERCAYFHFHFIFIAIRHTYWWWELIAILMPYARDAETPFRFHFLASLIFAFMPHWLFSPATLILIDNTPYWCRQSHIRFQPARLMRRRCRRYAIDAATLRRQPPLDYCRWQPLADYIQLAEAGWYY